MKIPKNLFDEFPAGTREEWIALVEKDLRGEPLADLSWQLEEDIVLDPFYHPDDFPVLPEPLGAGPEPSWSIGEFVQVRKVDEARQAILEAIEGGVDALLLVLYRPLQDGDLDYLLEPVDLSVVSIHFTEYYTTKEPRKVLKRFRDLVHRRELDPGQLEGSVDFDPILDWVEPPYDELKEACQYCREQLPLFRMLQINGLHLHAGPEHSSNELALLIAKGSTYLHEMKERGLPPESLLPRIQFNVALSTSFFVEVAKLRALRLLWANVLKAYELDGPPPFIIGHLARDSQVEDVYQNIIRASTQAFSGIAGGANRLYLRPADFYQENSSTPFTRRMARNIQHILKLETGLDRVEDPGAGSFYIEKLTSKLAEKAWKQFQELESEGGY